MSDLVSIIMPSYNTDKFIKQSIESVIKQTYENWELIIVDDCSTDNTDQVVLSIQDERIIYLKNEVNSGAAVSRNRALREAKGRWIAFLDSDDLWMPDKLEKQIAFMENNGYHFSYTNYEEMDEDGKLTGVKVTGPKKITKTGMYNYCWPGCLTVMYDAQIIGLIQIEDIKKNNDYAMWLKICKKANCYLLDACLAKYRRGRVGSVSSNNIKTLIWWHFKLFRYAEKLNTICSFIYMTRNLLFGVYKKRKYIKKEKICLIGHYAKNKHLMNGQTVKTKIITDEVIRNFGNRKIITIDTHGAMKNLLLSVHNCKKALANSQNVIIMPAENGLKVYGSLLFLMNKIYKKKLFYVVIGGWLPEFLVRKKILSFFLKNFDYIFVETQLMKKKMEKQGFNNVYVLTNSKNIQIVDEKNMKFSYKEPYKLCTFSRVMKEKGIEDAVYIVKKINEKYKKSIFKLDIYGQVDEKQKQWFDELKEKFSNDIKYKGVVPYDRSTEVLKDYYALLFLTYYEGEGVAGTLIDAMAAGLPVLATNWKYNSDVIKNKKNGFLIDNISELEDKLMEITEVDVWKKMKLECVDEAKQYLPENALKMLMHFLADVG